MNINKLSLLTFLFWYFSFSPVQANEVEGLSYYWEQFTDIFFTSDTTITKEEAASITLSEQLEAAYLSVNGLQKEYFDSLLKKNMLPNHMMSDTQYLEKRIKGIHFEDDFKIFGWHPYWSGDAFNTYNYDLLSHISWFSYSINPKTGAPMQSEVIDQLLESGLVDLAHEKGTKVLLTISCFGKRTNQEFFKDDYGQVGIAINNIVSIIKSHQLDGVDINFENVPKAEKENFTKFVKRLTAAVKKEKAFYEVTLTIPKTNTAFDISKLNSIVDFYILTGYDFHTKGSKTDGPIAPLRATKNGLSIETIVKKYIDKENIDTKKLIVALPYYGGLWHSGKKSVRSKNKEFIRHLTYRNIMSTYGHLGPPEYDPVSLSAYYTVKKDATTYEKVWFEDTISLANKFNWIKEQNLAGAGIWALGYDNGHTGLWKVIDNTFTQDTLVQLELPQSQVFTSALVLYNYRYPVFLGMLFILFFILFGFSIALFDWRVREYIFRHKTSRLLLLLSTFLLLGVSFSILSNFYGNWFADNQSWIFIIGITVGFMISLGVNQIFSKRRQLMP